MPPQEKSHDAACATVELPSSRRLAMARHTRIAPREKKEKEAEVKVDAVSYTHLTLPTKA